MIEDVSEEDILWLSETINQLKKKMTNLNMVTCSHGRVNVREFIFREISWPITCGIPREEDGLLWPSKK